MKTNCHDADDALVIRLSDKTVVREVSQDWNTHVSCAADGIVVETMIRLANFVTLGRSRPGFASSK